MKVGRVSRYTLIAVTNVDDVIQFGNQNDLTVLAFRLFVNLFSVGRLFLLLLSIFKFVEFV